MNDLPTVALIVASIVTVFSVIATIAALMFGRKLETSLRAKNRQLPPSPDSSEPERPLSSDADEPDR